MPLPKQHHYTSADYWNLPDGERAELIDGQLYNMAPPSRIHQKLVMKLSASIQQHIDSKGGSCEVYPAPFAVNLNADDKTYVEPDISVICDKHKLTDRGCEGAPDLVIEVVSPSSSRMDYIIKLNLYMAAGVREYWIVDPLRQRTIVYHLESGDAPTIFAFNQTISVGIFPELAICIADMI